MKKKAILRSFLAVCTLVSVGCQDENDTNGSVEENRAFDLVKESIAAHGGSEAWYDNGDLQFRWTYLRSDIGPDAIIDSKQTVNPKTLAVAHTVPNSSTTFGWVDGVNWIKDSDGKFPAPTQFWSLLPVYFIGIPFVFNDEGANFELLPETMTFEGKGYQQVKITYPAGAGESPDDYYVLLIDPETKKTRGTYYTVTHPAVVGPDGPGPAKFIALDDLEEFDGVLLSTAQRTFKMTDGKIGDQMRSSTATEIKFLPEGMVDLTVPEGAEIVD